MSKVTSNVTGRQYEDECAVFYKNAKQSAWMVNHGATLLDVIPTEENMFIFAFSREEHKKYINEWNATRPVV